MSDLLARVDDVARDLLSRVDAILLVAGVPAGHPAAALLPEARALPGEAFAGFAGMSPAALADAAHALRGLLDRYAVEHRRLAARPRWEGATAAAALSRAAGLTGRLHGSGGDTLGGRLAATVRYLEEVAGWLSAARDAMAVTVARCLTSAEAVTVRAAVPPEAVAADWRGGGAAIRPDALAAPVLPAGCAAAAATVAAEVLRTAVRVHREGCDLYADWSGRLGETTYHPAAPERAPAVGRLDLPL